jgi:hypothetical protein
MNINDTNVHTRPTVKMPAMKDPFYRKVTCEKVLGGTHALWQAKLKLTGETWGTTAQTLTGAGGTAELAIKDLQAQLRELDASK